MAAPKFIEIDGKRFVWRDILQRRREQRMAAARIDQPALFELKEDCRSVSEVPPPGATASPACSRLSSRTGRAAWRSLTFRHDPLWRRNPGFQPLRIEYVTKSRSSHRFATDLSFRFCLCP